MLSRTGRSLAALGALSLGVGLTAAGAVLSPAAACDGAGVACAPETPESNGNTVTVTVTGSFVGGGADGSPGSGSTTVTVPTPCTFHELWSGKEYYEGIEDGTITGAGSDEAEAGTWKPNAGYEQHKDDTKGHWYHPSCTMLDGMFDSFDQFDRFAESFFDENPGIYVEDGGTPPVPPVPPEVLLQAAQEAMTMPEPVFDHNPRRAADEATLVNLDTWFWLEDARESGEVTATAGPNSVTVEATLQDVRFVGENAGAVSCDGTGVRWRPGAASDCFLQFVRAGSNGVTASSTWGLTWSFNGAPMGTLDAVGNTWSADVDVVESQALVTEVG